MLDATIDRAAEKFGEKLGEKTKDLEERVLETSEEIKSELYSVSKKIDEDVKGVIGFFGIMAIIDTALLAGILIKVGRVKLEA